MEQNKKATIADLEQKLKPERSHKAIWNAAGTLVGMGILNRRKIWVTDRHGGKRVGRPGWSYQLLSTDWRAKDKMLQRYSKKQTGGENVDWAALTMRFKGRSKEARVSRDLFSALSNAERLIMLMPEEDIPFILPKGYSKKDVKRMRQKYLLRFIEGVMAVAFSETPGRKTRSFSINEEPYETPEQTAERFEAYKKGRKAKGLPY